MSTTVHKRSYSQAIADAIAFRALFPRACYDRWEIAGSIRRRRPEVGDVEHVIIPCTGEVPGGGLFPETVNLLWRRIDELVSGGELAKHVSGENPSGGPRHKWGQKSRAVDFRGFSHDIYTADAENWGAQLAIRTGPSQYSRMLVMSLQRNGFMNDDSYVWNKRDWICACGWRGSTPIQVEGALPGGMVQDPEGRDGPPCTDVCPKCGHHETLKPVRVQAPDEKTYFRLCGVPYAEPENRFDPAPAGTGVR